MIGIVRRSRNQSLVASTGHVHASLLDTSLTQILLALCSSAVPLFTVSVTGNSLLLQWLDIEFGTQRDDPLGVVLRVREEVVFLDVCRLSFRVSWWKAETQRTLKVGGVLEGWVVPVQPLEPLVEVWEVVSDCTVSADHWRTETGTYSFRSCT